MNLKNMSKNEKIYYLVLCCLAFVIISSAWEDGINRKLITTMIGMFFFQAYLYCQLFHRDCVTK